MNVASLVKAVIMAYDDAASLVKRIQAKRLGGAGPILPEEPAKNLLESLTLGPAIIRGYYEHDAKRFGEAYATGDRPAREELKDIFIHLEISLSSTLRKVEMDNTELDFPALQTAADDCRANAGVCLGQLSLRLSNASRASWQPSQTSGYPMRPNGTPMTPPLQYSSSRSTQSSAYSTDPPPVTPDAMADAFGGINSIAAARRPSHPARKMSASSVSSSLIVCHSHSRRSKYGSGAGQHGARDDHNNLSSRRPSSQALPHDDAQLLYPSGFPPSPPISPRRPTAPDDDDRVSYTSGRRTSNGGASNWSRTSSYAQGRPGSDIYGSDENTGSPLASEGRGFSYGSLYEARQANSVANRSSYQGRTNNPSYSTLEHVEFLRQSCRGPVPDPSRAMYAGPPQPQVRQSTYNNPPPSPRHLNARSPTQVPTIPSSPTRSPQSQRASGFPIPLNPAQQVSSFPLEPTVSNPSITTVASHNSSSVVLKWPTEKSLQGFCKGAFRLQNGMEKKAFGIANRPDGLSRMVQFWQCRKCSFEGPMHTTKGSKKNKPEKIFDPRVRVSGGVRFKWIFLAKCHITTKSLPEANALRDGSHGSYGCLFCSAEGVARGWTSKAHGGAGTPIFGNVKSFMEHINNVHRGENGWPGIEMRGRMKCVVGRLAEDGEDWEINLPL